MRALGLKLNKESWDCIYRTSDVDAKVKMFTTTLVNILDKKVPKCTIGILQPHGLLTQSPFGLEEPLLNMT